jgi:hypothetical protein
MEGMDCLWGKVVLGVEAHGLMMGDEGFGFAREFSGIIILNTDICCWDDCQMRNVNGVVSWVLFYMRRMGQLFLTQSIGLTGKIAIFARPAK